MNESIQLKDTVLITKEFVEANNAANQYTEPNSIWKEGETARVCEIAEYGQIRLVRGIWSTWVVLPLVQRMRKAYLNRENKQESMEY